MVGCRGEMRDDDEVMMMVGERDLGEVGELIGCRVLGVWKTMLEEGMRRVLRMGFWMGLGV